MKRKGLTPRQRLFVREYLVDLNATQAAIRAGYSAASATTDGPRMLENAGVRRAIDKALARREAKVEVRGDDVLRELATFGYFDPAEVVDRHGRLLPLRKMPEHVRRAIASIEIEEIWEGHGKDRAQVGELKKVKFWNKKDALDLMGRHVGLFPTKVEASGRVSVDVNLNVRLDYSLLTVAEHRQLVALMKKATPLPADA